MSWIRKFRGDNTAPITSDYDCAEHGRFEATLPRVGGEAPDTTPCPTCGAPATWCVPSPRGRVKPGEVVQGKVMEYPPEQVCLDTRPLADGMPLAEWKAKQNKITRDLGLKRSRELRR